MIDPQRYGPWALVTGASDGIGEAFARQLAAAGLNLLLVARRGALLESLAAEIRTAHAVEVRVLAADLIAPGCFAQIVSASEELEIGLLVCNAGATHGAAHFLDREVDTALGLIELNCRMPVRLAHWFGNRMRERGRGGILLLSSLAALSGGSNTAIYNATKSFDLIFAEGLWHELQPAGVDAMCLMVGATLTPSMLGSAAAMRDYPNIMEPEAVAAEGLNALGSGPVWVAGAHNRAIFRRLLPVARVGAINALSAATASIYGLPSTPVAGEDVPG